MQARQPQSSSTPAHSFGTAARCETGLEEPSSSAAACTQAPMPRPASQQPCCCKRALVRDTRSQHHLQALHIASTKPYIPQSHTWRLNLTPTWKPSTSPSTYRRSSAPSSTASFSSRACCRQRQVVRTWQGLRRSGSKSGANLPHPSSVARQYPISRQAQICRSDYFCVRTPPGCA